tara:strand:+ start:142 stop:492 length:351 start_codon:yes stop_codon:yes gene_type:complete
MMPTMQQINAAHTVVRLNDKSLYDALAPIFYAARRGVETDGELNETKFILEEYKQAHLQAAKWQQHYLERAEKAEAANVKLVGAIDMIRETLNGGNVEDLLLIINNALEEARNVQP